MAVGLSEILIATEVKSYSLYNFEGNVTNMMLKIGTTWRLPKNWGTMHEYIKPPTDLDLYSIKDPSTHSLNS